MPRWFAPLLALVVLFGACSPQDADSTTDESGPAILEAEPTTESLEAIDFENDLEGVVTTPARVELGDCLNDYVWWDRAGNRQQAMTRVGCDRPHDKEIYHVDIHPGGDGEPFPGDRKLEEFAQDICLERFEPFVDREYVLSDLEIGIFTPDFESWNSIDDRSISCFVFAFEGGLLQGSMRRIGL